MHRVCRLILLAAPLASPAAAQPPPTVGIIDFYGLRTIDERDVRALLPFAEGDREPRDPESIAAELTAALGVESVQIARICCTESGDGIAYVGIEEVPMPGPEYHASPARETTLPGEVVRTSEALDEVIHAAVLRGEAQEDYSHGHSLAHDPAARRLQERFVGYAEAYGERLIEVLESSSDAGQRALAAQVVAYAADKAAVVPHLERAALDPDDGVRNNATRALMIIARYAVENPSLGIEIHPDPFIDMLGSIHFSDRNKGSALLAALTESRDVSLLRAIRERALFPLIEMCHWKSPGHATLPCLILERALGLPEQPWPHDADAKRALTAAALLLLPPELRSAADTFLD